MERLPPQPWMTSDATRAVLDALQAEGGPGIVRFVGGCVRNTVLDQPVDDVDLATPLTPERVVRALEVAGLRAVPTGVEHGTITAVSGGRPYEITTLRRDVETDGRRAVVAFTDDWREDAARRDFRLNALYAEPDGTLHDPTGGGLDDARAGRVVFVGDAETRIREDYLRILRFFRFGAWYGHGAPDAEGLAACERLRGGIGALSAERLGRELLKLLAATDPRAAVRAMHEAGVLTEVLPAAAAGARFEALVALSPDPVLRLAALLPEDAAAIAAAAARLRLSNAQRDRLLAAVGAIEVTPAMSEREVRASIYRRGAEAVRDRLLLCAAAEPGSPTSLLEITRTWAPPSLPIGGADLVRAGLAPGPELGEALRRAERLWIDSDFRLDGEGLLRLRPDW